MMNPMQERLIPVVLADTLPRPAGKGVVMGLSSVNSQGTRKQKVCFRESCIFLVLAKG